MWRLALIAAASTLGQLATSIRSGHPDATLVLDQVASGSVKEVSSSSERVELWSSLEEAASKDVPLKPSSSYSPAGAPWQHAQSFLEFWDAELRESRPIPIPKPHGVAHLPPMGYSTWNSFGCNISEKFVKDAARKLISSGLGQLGYTHFNIDDCWMQAERGPAGELLPSAEFPSGMRAMGDFLHARGLKFGLYTSRGSKTCEERAGSLGHEEQDATSFASWGLDFLKNDGCYDTECFADWRRPKNPDIWKCEAENRKSVLNKYRKMRDALNATGRKIVYEVCGWEPWYAPVGAELSNMYRIGSDVIAWEDVYRSVQLMDQLGHYSKPGSWAHPDMLVGSSDGSKMQLKPLQSRAQFTLWAVFPAPLIIGTNVAHMNVWDMYTYSNPEVIAINQDRLLRPAKRLYDSCPPYLKVNVSEDGFSSYDVEGCKGWECAILREGVPFAFKRDPGNCQQAWGKVLEDGDLVVAAVNWGNVSTVLSLPLHLHRRAYARDLWKRYRLPDVEAGVPLSVPLAADGGHALIRISKR